MKVMEGKVSMDQSNLDDFDSRLPRDGDSLFGQSTWAFDAHIVRDPAERFYRMPMGYKRAGDLLIDQAAANVVDRANVIYPALFCYRQSIELSLKRFIEEFGSGREDPSRNSHQLSVLWRSFIKITTEHEIGNSIELLAAGKVVTELHDADERSDGFRFPSDGKGNAFPFGDKEVDLDNLREVMQGVGNFFECTYMAISYQHDGGRP
jgi:hypothetical protein